MKHYNTLFFYITQICHSYDNNHAKVPKIKKVINGIIRCEHTKIYRITH